MGTTSVRDVFDRFEFAAQVERLAKAGLLYQVAEKFARVDLHPDRVDNHQMGLVFEELIRKFAELSNETAGEHFTPREVTQPKAWEALVKSHGSAASTVLLDRLRHQMDQRGTLDVLRHGIEVVGLRQPVSLAQFRPALAMNAELQARYQANRLRVVRQVRYSAANQNALDLVLFLNGLPVATAELKSDYTQSVDDAVDQYRFDRDPRPKGHLEAAFRCSGTGQVSGGHTRET